MSNASHFMAFSCFDGQDSQQARTTAAVGATLR
jgi:hypothetical protein